MLALEEHLYELGDAEGAARVRDLRRLAVDEAARLLSGLPARETRLRATWCVVKHALLAWYHAYEASLMAAPGSDALRSVAREMLELARAALEEGLKPAEG